MMPLCRNMRLSCCIFGAIFCYTIAFTATETVALNQAKNKLKQLDTEIAKLRKTLTNAHDKRGLLNQELADNEKKIGAAIQSLRSLQQDMTSKRQKINSLQQRVNELNKQLVTQQQLLAEHVRIRYKMGGYQPIKWILNQDDPWSISRLLTFHQYLVQSRQTLIDTIDTTKHSLTDNQHQLTEEIKNQQVLEKQWHDNQQKLEKNKHYHTAVIQTLNSDIQSKQRMLSEFEHNKQNLAHLLTALDKQEKTIVVNKQPFISMRHKLLAPIHHAKRVQKTNQGVTFIADEGAPVYAVYSGKIVFSDWLNGYGLLLIIDHGQGFMSLYAHNQSLFKHKGVTISQGEQIAAVGHSGGSKESGLYFEVRQRGKAIPPLEWLG